MKAPTKDDVCVAACRAAFGERLIQNNLRAIVVEVIVNYSLASAGSLASAWKHCSSDWKGWDFEHADGTRLEVKQSALRQSWAPPKSTPRPRFDIAPRAGYYEGAVWTVQPGRHAHIYVFAYHPLSDDTADHRDAAQWLFYVVPASKLPLAKTIAEPALNQISATLGWDQLFDVVERERIALTPLSN